MNSSTGRAPGRRPPSRSLPGVSGRFRTLGLLAAALLVLALGLLAPSAAPASARRPGAHGDVPKAASNEPGSGASGSATGAGESTGGSGESPSGSGESPTGSGESTTGAGGDGAAAGGSNARGSHADADAGAGACRVALEAAPRRVTAGETAALSGLISCSDPSHAGAQTVTIYVHSAGTPGSSPLASVDSEASGAFHLTTEALETDSTFYARISGTRSVRVPVAVAPLVTISGPARPQLTMLGRDAVAGSEAGSTVTFTGTVSPEQEGALVELQREGANVEASWRTIAWSRVGPQGSYSITHRFGIPGPANVRALVKARKLPPGISEVLSYQIAQRQNRRLTIDASVSPLTFGGALTISGVASGGGHEPLTLLAGTPGRRFVPVATTTAEGDGSYAFSPQSPLHATWYEVSAGRVHSTTIFEGVKRQLNARPSSSSVSSGESVAFTGTATPASEGEVVDLQRENAAGSGFHVVQTATLGPGGSFTIEHVLSGAGEQAFRVVVPGCAGMQATASAVLELAVTPTLGTTLEAQAPGATFAGS
ncbi:MAG TPA: hypothetical protein VMF09_11140 [Solirubrobacteraceae bacterium]|nr:hypothetical protein [Solirubrobacteraceae bacterium]